MASIVRIVMHRVSPRNDRTGRPHPANLGSHRPTDRPPRETGRELKRIDSTLRSPIYSTFAATIEARVGGAVARVVGKRRDPPPHVPRRLDGLWRSRCTRHDSSQSVAAYGSSPPLTPTEWRHVASRSDLRGDTALEGVVTVRAFGAHARVAATSDAAVDAHTHAEFALWICNRWLVSRTQVMEWNAM